MSGYAFILVVPKNSGEIIHMHITGRLPEAAKHQQASIRKKHARRGMHTKAGR